MEEGSTRCRLGHCMYLGHTVYLPLTRSSLMNYGFIYVHIIDGTTQTLPEQLSFMHIPKPFKNPAYTKNATRRTQTLKTLLSREKERDKAARLERSKLKGDVEGGEVKMEVEGIADPSLNAMDGEDKMDIDAAGERRPVVQLELDEDEIAEGIDPDDVPSCESM